LVGSDGKMERELPALRNGAGDPGAGLRKRGRER
jgi:hypothetical protein